MCGPIRKLCVTTDGFYWVNVKKQDFTERYANAKTEEERKRITAIEALRLNSHRHIGNINDTIPECEPPSFVA